MRFRLEVSLNVKDHFERAKEVHGLCMDNGLDVEIEEDVFRVFIPVRKEGEQFSLWGFEWLLQKIEEISKL